MVPPSAAPPERRIAAAAADAGAGERRRPGFALASRPGSAATARRSPRASSGASFRRSPTAPACSASPRKTAARTRSSRCRPATTWCMSASAWRARRKAVHLSEAAREIFELPAGGIKLEGRVGDVPIRGGQVTFDIYRGSQFEPGDKRAARAGGRHRQRRHRARGRLSHRLQLRRHQRGGALRHPRPDRQAHRRDGEPPRRRHHAQARERGRRRSARQHQLVGLTLGGDVIKESTGAFPRVVLAEGDYRAIARSDGRTYERNFKVISGVDGEIEVIAR